MQKSSGWCGFAVFATVIVFVAEDHSSVESRRSGSTTDTKETHVRERENKKGSLGEYTECHWHHTKAERIKPTHVVAFLHGFSDCPEVSRTRHQPQPLERKRFRVGDQINKSRMHLSKLLQASHYGSRSVQLSIQTSAPLAKTL